MRKLLITVSDNKIVASNDFLGYQGEHNATKLIFELPEELKSDDYNYSVNITLPDGITASTPLVNHELTVTSTLTVNSGTLQLQLMISKEKELIYKSGTVNLTIKKSIIPNAVIGGGSGVVSAVVDDEGYLIITLTDGTSQNAGLVKGEKGEQGEQGSAYNLTDTDKQELANKISAEIIKGIIEHNVPALEIPDGTAQIAECQFQNNSALRRVVAPDSLETIGKYAFQNCFRMTGIDGLGGLKTICDNAFENCYSLTDFEFAETLETIGTSAFRNCSALQNEDLILPNCKRISAGAFLGCMFTGKLDLPKCEEISASAFTGSNFTSLRLSNALTVYGAALNCASLEFVDLGTDFNCNNFNLSMSTKYSVDTLVGVLNSLKDRTGETAYTLTLGTTNLAKLTSEKKEIATNKNWVLK
jgi:hypothetical protein